MKKPLRLSTALLLILSAQLASARAQSQGAAAHLTVYDAGLAELLEERAVELQPGLNQVEWRSLMPKAFARTLRVTAEDAEVERVDVTYDGVEVRGQRSPVLHLFIRNGGRAGQRRVQVDYLAPDISWRGDYSLSLEPTADGAPPTAGLLDSWVSLYNNTGTDLRAGTVDLVAGEVALLTGDGANRRDDETRLTVQLSSNAGTESEAPPPGPAVEATGLSAFSRFRLGREVALNANVPLSRLPLFGRRLLDAGRHRRAGDAHHRALFERGRARLHRALPVERREQLPDDARHPPTRRPTHAPVPERKPPRPLRGRREQRGA